MRAETGVQNLYEDIVDEVQFRHRIYDLTYHEFESDQRQKEALEREALATERRQEREKAEQERIKQENDRRIQAEKDAK